MFVSFFRVCGFDHADLDEQQDDWHTHLYPYKLSAYRKKLLSEPISLGVLHYDTASAAHRDTSVDLSHHEAMYSAMKITHAGSCDAVVLWVDYELSDHHHINQWNGYDFPIYLTANVKFFPLPRAVQVGEIISSCIRLDDKKADFEYSFNLEN